jgi:Na+/phosphate symporter
MLHTLFNVINTCILIWFPGAIERIVTTVIKGRKENAEEVHKLKYIGSVAEYIG